jgi:penicillin amidase
MTKKGKKTFSRILIAIFAILVGISLWGFITVRRSFPQTDGTIAIQGLSDEVQIYRDSMGIPHIYASNEKDLFLAQGYIHAQDRFFQMDLWRHTGEGRLSEMFGESMIGTDKFLRTMGWTRTVQEELTQLDPDILSNLEAYAEGVNAYLSDHVRTEISFEYAILALLAPSYEPAPWEPVDTVTWAKVMAFDLSGNSSGWQDLERAKLYKLLGEEKAKELHPSYPDDNPTIVPDPAFETVYSEQHPEAAWLQSFSSQSSSQAMGLITTKGIPGSNSWAISGSRTSTGEPILANDPHLGVQMPSIWYEIGLHCRPVSESCRFNVTGFSFAGVPGVVIGHNDWIAWGLTNVGPDVLDLYIERINPENPNQYEVNGHWEDMIIVDEVIEVAGGDSQVLSIRHTRHGPVFSDIDDRFDDLGQTTNLEVPSDYVVSVRWTAFDPTFTLQALTRVNLAQDWESFRDAVTEFDVPSQNLIYADVYGNIGYQTPGKIPIRANGDGLFPVPGWTDEYEWERFIPFEELPYSLNPTQGFIVTANNAIMGPDYPYSISKTWDLGYRARRISDLIQNKSTISIEDVQAIQGDNYNQIATVLIPLLKDLTYDDSTLIEHVTALGEWNYQNLATSQQAAIFNSFWRHLLIETFGDEVPDHIPSSSYAIRLVETLLNQPNNPWWDDIETPQVENRNEILSRAFASGIAEIQEFLGRNSKNWQWGELHTLTFKHQMGIGPLDLLFSRGPFPTSGGSSIVNANSWVESEGYEVVVLPSMRMIVDLSNLENSFTMHTTGQSGHAFHPHYIDMAELWGNNQLHPMLWSERQVQEAQVSKLTLVPQE